ncbi:FAD-dependent oxidoreductase [Jonesia quinghaiensis]|uniref:FAD-dependent oxidoreductase n=1 Tax=Jonesia quinghaiensis TaxID=262806 RepID=UPI0004121BC5|nr:FAD-dependent oxidoreductase [Jonesia quinghaiensis]
MDLHSVRSGSWWRAQAQQHVPDSEVKAHAAPMLPGASEVGDEPCDVVIIDADASGLVEDEMAAASAVGLDAYLMHSADVRLCFAGVWPLDGQWRIDPMGALRALADPSHELGVRIVEGCRVVRSP